MNGGNSDLGRAVGSGLMICIHKFIAYIVLITDLSVPKLYEERCMFLYPISRPLFTGLEKELRLRGQTILMHLLCMQHDLHYYQRQTPRYNQDKDWNWLHV